jgi:hypothetical protein
MYMTLKEIKIPNPGKNTFSHGAAFGAPHSASMADARKQLATSGPVSIAAVVPTIGENPIQAPVGIRNRMHMTLKEIKILNPGKNTFSHGAYRAPRSLSSGDSRG